MELGLRYVRLYRGEARVTAVGSEDLAASPRQVAHHVAQEVVRSGDLDMVEWLEQDRLAFWCNGPEPQNSGHLERHLVGVDGVVRPVEELHLEVYKRIAGEDAARRCLLDSFI